MTCVLVRNNTVLMNPPGKNGSVKRIFIIRGALYPLKLGSCRLSGDIKVKYDSKDRVVSHRPQSEIGRLWAAAS